MKAKGYRLISVVLTALFIILVSVPAQAQLVKDFQQISNTEGGFTGILYDRDYLGSAVASLGDLDGDGIGDIVVGSPGDDENGSLRGSVWILFLNEDGTVRSHQKINESNGGFSGEFTDDEHFGDNITNLGDLNGDGIVDLAISGWGDKGYGAFWILFLNQDGTVKAHQKIAPNEGGFDGHITPFSTFGRSVANIGDLDGDGVIDLAVGDSHDDDGGTDRGAAWILFMNSDGTVEAHQKISEIAGGFSGQLDDGDVFGLTVANLGDVDGDGINDLAVGARGDDDGGSTSDANRGAVWILFLNATGTVKAHQKISDTEGGFTGGLDDGDRFIAISSMGDLDLDGVPDLAVGANADQDLGYNLGAVWLLFLRSDGTVKYHQKIAENQGDLITALNPGDSFGMSTANMDDFDGDGIQDMAVGAWLDSDGGLFRGAVWLLFMNRPGVTSFTLIDAETDRPIDGYDPIPDGAVLNLKHLPHYLNVRANIAGVFESVRFAFNGNANFRTENIEPYALFGDTASDYFGGRLRRGPQKLIAFPFTEDGAQGEAGVRARLNFTVISDDLGLAVTRYVLIDADTDADLQILEDGDELDLATLPPHLNVRADVAGPVESIRFTLEPKRHMQVENHAPYALFGNASGEYASGVFYNGRQTLTAFPFHKDKGQGQVGAPLSIRFGVINGPNATTAPEVPFDALSLNSLQVFPDHFMLDAAYPNPFNPSTTIHFALPEQAQVRLTVYDMLGREVERLVDGVQEAGNHEIIFDAGSLPSGTYLYRLETPEGSFTQTMLLLK